MCGSHHVYADTLFKARRSPAFAVVLWLPAEGGNWNCLRTKFSLCTNFILQKLLVQMVNNSSLAVSGDRAHLNFLYLSNLYNAHKFKKVPTHCTIDGAKVGLKGQRAAAGSVCTVRERWKNIFSNIHVKEHEYPSEHLTAVYAINITCASTCTCRCEGPALLMKHISINRLAAYVHVDWWFGYETWFYMTDTLNPVFTVCTIHRCVQWCAGKAAPQRGRQAG